jgi:membrane protease YdiL (CAAX protease family)
LFLFALFLALAIASIPEGERPRHPAAGESQRVPSQAEILRAFEEEAASSTFLGVVSAAFTLVVSIGIAIDLRFVWRLLKRRGGRPRSWPAASWELGDVAKAIIVFLMAFFSLDSLYPIFSHCLGELSDVSFVVIVQFLAELAALCFLIQCVSPRWRIALGELGLGACPSNGSRRVSIAGRPDARRVDEGDAVRIVEDDATQAMAGRRRGNILSHIATGVTAYVGFLPVLLLLTWLTEEAARLTGIGLEPQEQIGFFFADLSYPALIFLVIFVAIVGPVFEEIFFRGFAYQALRRRWGRWPSVLATALLFSLLHASFSVFLPILGLGVLLACVFEASGSLVPSIVVHICQNSVAVAGALLVRSLSP